MLTIPVIDLREISDHLSLMLLNKMYKYRYRDNNRCIKHQLLFLSLTYQLHQVRLQLHKESHNLAQVIN